MAVQLFMDVHVPGPITRQLRLRGVNVLTAQEDGHGEAADDLLLARARELNRILFTQDTLFRVLAEQWQREGRPFAGVLFGSQLAATIGQFVEDLELIAKASDAGDWTNVIQFLPLRR